MKAEIKINKLKIKDLKAEKNLTDEQIANTMGVTRNTLLRLLKYDYMAIDHAKNLGKALGVDLSEIKSMQTSDGEFVGFSEIKEMYNNIIAAHLETIKSQQRSIENLSMALGKLERFDEIPVDENEDEIESKCVVIEFRPVYSTIKTA